MSIGNEILMQESDLAFFTALLSWEDENDGPDRFNSTKNVGYAMFMMEKIMEQATAERGTSEFDQFIFGALRSTINSLSISENQIPEWTTEDWTYLLTKLAVARAIYDEKGIRVFGFYSYYNRFKGLMNEE